MANSWLVIDDTNQCLFYYYLIMWFNRLGEDEDEDLSPRNQPLPLMREGPEEEEFTPVPRPSPSPHPQNFQVRLQTVIQGQKESSWVFIASVEPIMFKH